MECTIKKVADISGGRTFDKNRSGGSANGESTTAYSVSDLVDFVKQRSSIMQYSFWDATIKKVADFSQGRQGDETSRAVSFGGDKSTTIYSVSDLVEFVNQYDSAFRPNQRMSKQSRKQP